MSYFKGSRVLVAGGAGFIGSYLVELLLADGARVTVADNLSRGSRDNLTEVQSEVRILEIDLRDREAAFAACRGQDVVMNLAAPVTGLEYSIDHHGEMLSETLILNTNVILAAIDGEAERYLYCSSSCVYPDDAVVPTPETEALRGTPETANEGYGWGKRMGELQAQYFAHQGRIQVAIGRPFNAFGPRERPEDISRAHVIPALLSKILRGDDPLIVWGSGRQTRSFVHARDFALGLKLITESYASADPVNVGHDRETSIRQLVDLLLHSTGRTPSVTFDESKPEGAIRKAADTSKLSAVTSFVPTMTLEAGINEMVDFFAEQVREASSPRPT